MRELLRSLSRRAPRYWAYRPCRARPRPSCGRPVDPGGRRCGIPGDTVFVEPGSYAEPGMACPANPALTCGVAIAKDGISLIGLMHGRRQVGCRPVGAGPLKCAVCGTVVSWPNGTAAASQTCPVRWPISRPLDARTGRSVPLMTNPAWTGSAYSGYSQDKPETRSWRCSPCSAGVQVIEPSDRPRSRHALQRRLVL